MTPPYFAPAPDAHVGSPKRSLILAGGGMRLSYQAGVLRALGEASLSFTHVDGTSGGAINLAMLFSGLTPVEICDRWRTLNPRDFVSLLPFAEYLKIKDFKSAGDADGVRKRVFPHLGIDMDKVRAVEGIEGTFNVCNFSRKTNEVIPHRKIDEDFLVAGMSLPGTFPPVRKGDSFYLDSAFLRDANLMEAVRRGADELWVVWVLGNTPEYRGGLLDFYVQLLEMSANGSLHGEFERIEELNERIAAGDSPYGQQKPVTLHLIKPEYPLPLDPDLLTGQIDNATLIDMGYSDAARYLDGSREGLPLRPETTAMKTPSTGVSFREELRGHVNLKGSHPGLGEGKQQLVLEAIHRIPDVQSFMSDPETGCRLFGHLHLNGRNHVPIREGRFRVMPAANGEHKRIFYDATFRLGDNDYRLEGRKDLRDDPGFDLWDDLTTVRVTLESGGSNGPELVGDGELRLTKEQVIKTISSFRVLDSTSVLEKTGVVVDFGRFLMGEVWDRFT